MRLAAGNAPLTGSFAAAGRPPRCCGGGVLRAAIMLCILVCSKLLAQGVSDLPDEKLVLAIVDELETFGCLEVEGEIVVLLKPGIGVLVLAAKEFSGSEIIGSSVGNRLRFSFPGLRVREMVVRSKISHSSEQPIWGTLYRGVELNDRPGCFSLDRQAVPNEVNLHEFVERLVNDIFLVIPENVLSGRKALRISDRTVALEISQAGHQPLRVEWQEARYTDFRWSESSPLFNLVPVILDSSTNEVVLLFSTEGEAVVDPKGYRPASFVELGPVSESLTVNDSEFDIKVVGIGVDAASQ